MPTISKTTGSIPFPLRTVKDLASKPNAPPFFSQSFLSIAGEGIATLGGASLAVAKNGFLSSFVTLIGLGISGAGFFLQPIIKEDEIPASEEALKEEVLPLPPAQEIPAPIFVTLGTANSPGFMPAPFFVSQFNQTRETPKPSFNNSKVKPCMLPEED